MPRLSVNPKDADNDDADADTDASAADAIVEDDPDATDAADADATGGEALASAAAGVGDDDDAKTAVAAAADPADPVVADVSGSGEDDEKTEDPQDCPSRTKFIDKYCPMGTIDMLPVANIVIDKLHSKGGVRQRRLRKITKLMQTWIKMASSRSTASSCSLKLNGPTPNGRTLSKIIRWP